MHSAPPEVFDLGSTRLRRTRPSDAEALFECASDAEVARFMDWPRATSFDEVRARVESRHERWERGIEYHWVLTTADADRAIGAISLRIEGDSAECGFFVHPREWGRGHATRALRAIADWALTRGVIARSWATCDAENAASARVLEKAGFVLEKRLRAHTVRPNLSPAPRDALLYARRIPAGTPTSTVPATTRTRSSPPRQRMTDRARTKYSGFARLPSPPHPDHPMERTDDTTTFEEYRDHLRQHLERVRETNRPLFVTSDGRTDAVVLSPQAYEDLATKADRMETLDAIRKGLEDMKAGRTIPLREAFDRIARKLGLDFDP